jgi:signal transduction histidine kinase
MPSLFEVGMQTKDSKHIHQEHLSQVKEQNRLSDRYIANSRFWWRSPLIGYALSLVFVIGAFVAPMFGTIEHIHDYFIGVPFVVGTFLVGWIWGFGPALVTLVVGALSADYWLTPPLHTLTFYRWPDSASFIPFIGIQLLVLYLITKQKKYRQQLLAAQQAASRQAEELAQSNAQLEQADQMKDQFLSMASHELKTPVTSIHGHLQLLMRRLKKQYTAIPELLPVHDSLATVDQQVKRLTNLVNDLLDINSLRTGKIPLRLVPCDLSYLCQKVITEQKAISERSIDLQCPSDPIILPIDEGRLSQVINNLVTNAIKYSPEQTVIHVEVRQRAEEVLLAVHNDGPVLSQEQQSAIFEPFYRSPAVQSSTTPGWGLGLAISKEIIEQHQGRLWVESAVGTGTTFFVALDPELAKI